MRYDAYRRQTSRAAASIPGAREVSLAGGFYGVQLALDGAYAIAALDLDGVGEPPYGAVWITWSEDADGERCCDDNGIPLGHVRPCDYGALPHLVARALLSHHCS